MVRLGFRGRHMGTFTAEVTVGRADAPPEDMRTILMLVDTGAAVSVIPRNLADELGVVIWEGSEEPVNCASGRDDVSWPEAKLKMFIAGIREETLSIMICPSPEDEERTFRPILGVNALDAWDLMVHTRSERLVPAPGARCGNDKTP